VFVLKERRFGQIGSRGRKSGFSSSILRAFAQQHRRHPDEPAPPGECAQHQAGCYVNFSPTSRRSVTRWMTVCRDGTARSRYRWNSLQTHTTPFR